MREVSIRTNSLFSAMSLIYGVFAVHGDTVMKVCVSRERRNGHPAEDGWPVTIALGGPHEDEACEDILTMATPGGWRTRRK